MTSKSPVNMEIDNPLLLKRSSSAPMINDINGVTMSGQIQTTPVRDEENGFTSRQRRFSTSFSPLSSPKPTLGSPRVDQLRREESSSDLLCREAAHERELNSAMVISQSWEDLTLVSSGKTCDTSDSSTNGSYSSVGSSKKNLTEALTLTLPCSLTRSPSPSPTLPLRQCFSPSFFKSNLSPSPTRKFATRRSQSPIAMRPSTLGPVKRKFELDDHNPPAKKGGLLQQIRLTPTPPISDSEDQSGVDKYKLTSDTTPV